VTVNFLISMRPCRPPAAPEVPLTGKPSRTPPDGGAEQLDGPRGAAATSHPRTDGYCAFFFVRAMKSRSRPTTLLLRPRTRARNMRIAEARGAAALPDRRVRIRCHRRSWRSRRRSSVAQRRRHSLANYISVVGADQEAEASCRKTSRVDQRCWWSIPLTWLRW
jgi:hypothetical protein